MFLALNQPRSSRIRALLCTVNVLLLAQVPVDAAETENWQVGELRFEHVRVLGTDAGSVTIAHRGGMTQLELAKLPPELQQRFGYDPAAVAEWKERAEQALESTTAAAREVEATRIEQAREQRRLSQPRAAANRPAAGDAGGRIEVDLKEEVDLRPVYANFGLYYKRQGRRPSCAIFAAVSAIELELARTVGLPGPLSEEFVIWAVRSLHPHLPLDDGYHFQEVMASIQAHGLTTQRLMPNTFGVPIDDLKPTSEAVFDASQRRNIIPVWYRPNDPAIVERIVYSLNNDTPVVIGVRWPHWRTLQQNNLLRDQKPIAGGGHAVTLIGYHCPDRNPENLVFLFRNSYGVDWGLGGCGFIAPVYLRQHLLSAFHVTTPDKLASAAAR